MLTARFKREPFILAPMAGVTDAVYRSIAYAHGAKLAYSEMVSVAGLAYASEKTWELVYPGPQEPPVAVQLFGSKPEQFAEAAAQVCDRLGERLAYVDINMACPVPKVFGKGEGCALMRTPDVAAECVGRAVDGCAGRVPVTVKIRAGVNLENLNAPEFAQRMVASGAAAVGIHGRTAKQMYRGLADWSVISRVVEAVDVPVIGSGDVYTPVDANRMLAETGCQAVFIARGSYGNPWIFERAQALYETGELPPAPLVSERFDVLRSHIQSMHAGGHHMARLRSIMAWYVKGLPNACQWRNASMQCVTHEDYLGVVAGIEDMCRQMGIWDCRSDAIFDGLAAPEPDEGDDI